MQAMDALKTYKYALLAATVQDMDVHYETAEVNNTAQLFRSVKKGQNILSFLRRPRHEEQVCRTKNKKGSTIDTIHRKQKSVQVHSRSK